MDGKIFPFEAQPNPHLHFVPIFALKVGSHCRESQMTGPCTVRIADCGTGFTLVADTYIH